MSTEMERLERLAERLRGVPAVDPGSAGRIRAWNLVSASLAAGPAAAAPKPGPWLSLRLAGALAAALAVLMLGTVVAAAQSLPDSALYPVKRFDENVRAALTLGSTARFNYRLAVAATRLSEAQAMLAANRLDLAEGALQDYETDLTEAAALADSNGSPVDNATLENRLQEAIEVHNAQLQQLLGEVTNPVAQAALQDAMNRALNTAPSSTARPKPDRSPKGSRP